MALSLDALVGRAVFMWLRHVTGAFVMPRDAGDPQSTNFLTALALAPGVLKTGIELVMRGTLQLFVPAPHRSRGTSGTSLSWILWERSMMACATGGWSSPA